MYVCVNLLLQRLHVVDNASRPNSEFHVRCLAHVIYLALKSCLELERSKVYSIRKMINSLCASEKRREMFVRARAKLGDHKYILPPLDVETWWNSTFYKTQSAYKCRHVPSLSFIVYQN